MFHKNYWRNAPVENTHLSVNMDESEINVEMNYVSFNAELKCKSKNSCLILRSPL